MKVLFPLIVSAVLLAACSMPTDTRDPSTGNFLCVPEHYAIAVPGTGGPGDGYDPEGGGYGTSALIAGQDVAGRVAGFQAKVGSGPQLRHQSLYVMLSPGSEVAKHPSDGAPLQAMVESEHLFRVAEEGFSWQVLESSGTAKTHWGRCAELFTEPGAFSCLRDLIIEDLLLTYPVHQTNLHLYPQIDDFLREKVDQWRCGASDIPINR